MWSLRSGSRASKDRVFSRPLSDLEGSFHWDAIMNGTADGVVHLRVDIHRDHYQQLTDAHFCEAWLALKHRYPVLAGQIEEHSDDEHIEIVVHEPSLSKCRDGEIFFLEGDEDKALEVVDCAVNAPRQLTNDLLASVVIVRPSPQNLSASIVFTTAHLLCDGIAHLNLARTFLNFLSSQQVMRADYPDMEDTIELALSSSSLFPKKQFSLAQQRWREMVARIISDRIQQGLQGGHGLPRTEIEYAATTPALSKVATIHLPADLSATLVQACRQHSITFGQAYPILAQLALSRVLHRRCLQGLETKEDWHTRLRQPTHTGGPVNLRPFFDEQWASKGGNDELGVHIGFYFLSLPRMPYAPPEDADATGAPAYSVLMSHKRFISRCKVVKQNMIKTMNRPLFAEMITYQARRYKEGKMKDVKIWRKRASGEEVAQDEIVRKTGFMRLAHGGSSIGRVDKWLPVNYPIEAISDTVYSNRPSSTSKPDTSTSSQATSGDIFPVLRLTRWATRLRCRPTELYLGSSSWSSKMKMYVYYDGNTYKEAVVQEWLKEIMNAAVWYLGGDQRDSA